jgi:hypothetical protein
MTSFDITKVNNSPASNVATPTKPYSPNGDIKTFVRAVRSQVNDFSDRDLITEFNNAAQKDTHCKSGSDKQPSIKYLKSVEKELKQVNAHVGGTVAIANEYAKLLHNQRHLDTADRKIQEQTFINTLRDVGVQDNTDKVTTAPLNLSVTKATIPSGTVKTIDADMIQPQRQAQLQPQPQQQFEISQATASYNLEPAPDIFSSPKAGGNTTYRIVPFNFMAGS